MVTCSHLIQSVPLPETHGLIGRRCVADGVILVTTSRWCWCPRKTDIVENWLFETRLIGWIGLFVALAPDQFPVPGSRGPTGIPTLAS
jgi:hypothetical protein